MPLSNLLKSAVGTCPFCHQKAGILSREHPDCRRTHQAGWQEMVQLAAQAAGFPTIQQVQNTSTQMTTMPAKSNPTCPTLAAQRNAHHHHRLWSMTVASEPSERHQGARKPWHHSDIRELA